MKSQNHRLLITLALPLTLQLTLTGSLAAQPLASGVAPFIALVGH